MNNDQCLRLIELYSSYRRLWNYQDPDYCNKSSREDAWKVISHQMNLPVGELKEKMKSLLGSYRREKSRVKKSRKTALGREDAYMSNWYAYDSFIFLADKNVPGETLDTTHHDEKLKNGVSSEKKNNQDAESEVSEGNVQNGKIGRERQVLNDTEYAGTEELQTQTQPSRKRKRTETGTQQELTENISEAIKLLRQCADAPSDSYYTFGQHIANELRKYDPITLAYVKRDINNIIFQADTGGYQQYETRLTT